MSTWRDNLIKTVNEQKDIMNKLYGFEELKHKIVQLEKEILSEQSKCRALQDELDRPMNVHRWRVLESSDPKRFDKIQQIQVPYSSSSSSSSLLLLHYHSY